MVGQPHDGPFAGRWHQQNDSSNSGAWQTSDASSAELWAGNLVKPRVDFDGARRTSGRETLAKKSTEPIHSHESQPPVDAAEHTLDSQKPAAIADKRRRRVAQLQTSVHDASRHSLAHSSHGVAGAAAARLRRARVRPITQQVEARPPPPLDARWGEKRLGLHDFRAQKTTHRTRCGFQGLLGEE